MSFTKMSLVEVVKKQYSFKLKANIDSFSSLVFIQMLAIFLSHLGGDAIYMSYAHSRFEATSLSADFIIGFTIMWAFITAINLTSKPSRYHDFTFIANRLGSVLSNILFLATVTFIGSVAALLAGNVVVVSQGVLFDYQLYRFPISWSETLIGYFIAYLYIFLFSSIGYLVGTLTQFHRSFKALIPIILFGLFFIDASVIESALQFYMGETAIALLIFKIVATTAILFAASAVIWNRLEVRP